MKRGDRGDKTGSDISCLALPMQNQGYSAGAGYWRKRYYLNRSVATTSIALQSHTGFEMGGAGVQERGRRARGYDRDWNGSQSQ